MVSPLTTGTEGISDAAPVDPGLSKPWLDLIADAEKHFAFYQEKCDAVDKHLGELKALADASGDREFKMFWANLEVLKPSIYARPPIPVVVPRFKDRRAINRVASDLLERCLVVACDREDINSVMIGVRDDLAVNSRGAAWVRYVANGDEESKFSEKVALDHLDRRDFLHDPARSWREVDWVARGSWLNAEAGQKRFKDKWRGVQYQQGKDKSDEYVGEKKARVWEIWHKGQNKVVWVSPGLEKVLDEKPPFLELEGFFPCPKPAFGTLQRRTTIPIPDFIQYKDQIEEINILTARISALSEGLRLKGFYAAGAEDLSTAIERAMKSTAHDILIPVANFAGLGGAGMKDSLVWMPLKEIGETIQGCVLLRKQLIDDVYQITGMSDIMRGSTDPNETLGAQELKSQYGSIRIREKQGALVAFARDLSRIMGEIMAENFQPETLVSMSQLQIPSQQEVDGQIQAIIQKAEEAAMSPEAQMAAQQNPQLIEQAKEQAKQEIVKLQETVTIEKLVELMRDQRLRPFILDIETDSTIQPNEDAEKQRRNEFIQGVGGFIQQAGPMVAQIPASGPLVAECLKFVASAFRAGRSLDSAIDDFADQIAQMAQQPKGPSPEEVKAKADADALAKKTDAELQLKQADIEAKRELARIDIDRKREEAALKADEHKRMLEAKAQEFMFAQGEREHSAKHAKSESERAETDHRRKMEMEGQTHAQRQQEALASAGVPPGYDFSKATEATDKMLALMAQALQTISDQNAAIQQGQESIAKAITAPRRMRGRDGHEYVSEAQVN